MTAAVKLVDVQSDGGIHAPTICGDDGSGYTGVYLGLYSSANGHSGTDFADFDWVRYKGVERR